MVVMVFGLHTEHVIQSEYATRAITSQNNKQSNHDIYELSVLPQFTLHFYTVN